jgi:hypothetical protein
MADGKSTSQRFQDYRPSKTALFWSCVACIAATLIVGFAWGGWVTGGSAQQMATKAADTARAQVAAAVCVKQFMAQPKAGTQLAALKQTSSWQRDSFVEKGGWAQIDGKTYDGAADLCAQQLAQMKAPSVKEAATSDTGSVAQ